MIALTEGQELTLTAGDGKVGDTRPASSAGPHRPDASAVQFVGGQFFDLAFFNHLATRDGSVVHLGTTPPARARVTTR